MSTAYLSRLTLRQVRIFLTVCQQESYSRAAEELALTQPAVSAQVRNLEELIGEPLFHYVGKRLSLTPAGRAMRRAGQDLMRRLVRVEMELAELRGVMQGTLTLAVESSAQYFMPERLAAFCRRHPEVEVQMRVLNHGEALKSLREDRYDLTIMGQVPDDRRLRFVPFRQNDLVAVAAPGHPLQDMEAVPLTRFLEFPLLSRESGSGTRLVFEELCQSRGAPRSPAATGLPGGDQGRGDRRPGAGGAAPGRLSGGAGGRASGDPGRGRVAAEAFLVRGASPRPPSDAGGRRLPPGPHHGLSGRERRERVPAFLSPSR